MPGSSSGSCPKALRDGPCLAGGEQQTQLCHTFVATPVSTCCIYVSQIHLYICTVHKHVPPTPFAHTLLTCKPWVKPYFAQCLSRAQDPFLCSSLPPISTSRPQGNLSPMHSSNSHIALSLLLLLLCLTSYVHIQPECRMQSLAKPQHASKSGPAFVPLVVSVAAVPT